MFLKFRERKINKQKEKRQNEENMFLFNPKNEVKKDVLVQVKKRKKYDNVLQGQVKTKFVD